MRPWKAKPVVLRLAGRYCYNCEYQSLTAHRLSRECIEIFKHLSLRGTVWPGACASAIGDLSKHFEKGDAAVRTHDEASADLGSEVERAPSSAQSQARHQPAIPEDSTNVRSGTPRTSRPDINNVPEGSQSVNDWHTRDGNWAAPSLLQASADDLLTIFSNPAAPGEANPFDGLDIPFWMNNDQMTTAWMDDWNQVL